MPHAHKNQKIGLLGGSFNPPHEGHIHASEVAIRRLKLDKIWWLVTPKNPLKEEEPAPLEERLQQCEDITEHNPKIQCTAVEESFGSPYTIDTITKIIQKNPFARFVWVMGADNLSQLNQWKRWEDIKNKIPIAIVSRPGFQTTTPMSRLSRVPEKNAAKITLTKPPAWVMLHGPESETSSTEMRKHKKVNKKNDTPSKSSRSGKYKPLL